MDNSSLEVQLKVKIAAIYSTYLLMVRLIVLDIDIENKSYTIGLLPLLLCPTHKSIINFYLLQKEMIYQPFEKNVKNVIRWRAVNTFGIMKVFIWGKHNKKAQVQKV